MDAKELGSEATWHLRGLSGLQGTLYGNVLHAMTKTYQRSLYKERIPQNTYINEDLPHKETPSPLRNKGRLYITIKTQNQQKSRCA